MKPESPFNVLPPVVVALTLLILAIEAMFRLADFGIIGGARGVGWRIAALEDYAFSSAVMDAIFSSWRRACWAS